jgi:3-methyladenine DNA glycosylase/8-oxoguanine DNA glycosylase
VKKKILKNKVTIEIVPASPFCFDATVFKPAHFPTSDTYWQSGKRWQTTLWGQKTLGLILENKGTITKPRINLHIYSNKKLIKDFLESLRQEIIYRFNLDLNLKEFIRKFKNDRILGPIFKKLKGMRPMTHGSLYDYLVVAVMLQNAPVKRSVSMMQALFKNYGTLLRYNRKELYCMWPPEKMAKVPEQELRALKIGYRAKNLLKMSEPFSKGEINEMELRNKPTEEQKQSLLDLYGVGPQSVGYIMVDVFHRWEFLEHISPWEGKILSKIIFDTDPDTPFSEKRLLKFFKKYGEYKALASHYIWEDLWWTRLRQGFGGQERKNQKLDWLDKLIRL